MTIDHLSNRLTSIADIESLLIMLVTEGDYQRTIATSSILDKGSEVASIYACIAVWCFEHLCSSLTLTCYLKRLLQCAQLPIQIQSRIADGVNRHRIVRRLT